MGWNELWSGRPVLLETENPKSEFLMEDVLKQIGEEGIHQLVSAFYRRVKSDDVLGPLYPKEDWEGAEQRLADFLVYRCGGSENTFRNEVTRV